VQNDSRLGRLLPLIVFALFLIIYLVCGSPEVGWGDSAKYSSFMAGPHFEARAGFHVGYSYTTALLVRLFPVGTYASRANHINALYTAVALMLLFIVLRRAVKSDAAALVGIAAVGVAHPIFMQATIAEHYPFFWMVIAAFIAVAAKWRETRKSYWLGIGGFIAGFGLCTNLSTGLFFSSIILFLLLTVAKDASAEWKQLWKPLAVSVAAFIIGLMPLIVSAVYVLATGGMDLPTLLREMTDLKYSGAFFMTDPVTAAKGIAIFIGLTCYAYPFLAGILILVGIMDQFRCDRATAVSLWVGVGLIILIFSTYMVPRMPFIYSTPLFLAGFWVAHGARRLFEKFPSRRAAAVALAAVIAGPVVIYGAVHLGAPKINQKLKGKIRSIPHRNSAKYFLVPWRIQGTGTETFAAELVDISKKKRDPKDERRGMLFYGDHTPFAPLLYLKTYEGKAEEIDISFTEKRVDAGAVYRNVISYRNVYFILPNFAPEIMHNRKLVPAPDPIKGPYWAAVSKD
jgi:hypothetical protein